MSRAVILIMIFGIGIATKAIGAERCNPPHRECGDAPITYACPPCPPSGIHFAAPVDAERYRRALEAYREQAEAKRSADPSQPLTKYDQTIKEYQRGIANYKAVVDAGGSSPK